MKKVLPYLLIAAGLILVIAVFFLFLHDVLPNNFFFLNLSVCAIVYLLIVTRWFNLTGSTIKFERSIGGLGILWWAIPLYSLFALILVAIPLLKDNCSFKVYIVLQVALLLIFAFFAFFSFFAKDNVNEVNKSFVDMRSGLKSIASVLESIELAVKLKPSLNQSESGIAELKENLKYITASTTPAAIQLEERILATLNELLSKINTVDFREVNSYTERVKLLMQSRKQQY